VERGEAEIWECTIGLSVGEDIDGRTMTWSWVLPAVLDVQPYVAMTLEYAAIRWLKALDLAVLLEDPITAWHNFLNGLGIRPEHRERVRGPRIAAGLVKIFEEGSCGTRKANR
jgi:hypothetical protein